MSRRVLLLPVRLLGLHGDFVDESLVAAASPNGPQMGPQMGFKNRN